MKTFLEGLASFVSPCVLPLLPVYLVYFAAGDAGRVRTAVRALAFVAGFTLVFVALGIAAGTLGSALSAHRRAVEIVCGVLVVLLGLGFMGLFRLPTLGRARRVEVRGVVSAFLFGIVFSLCLSPCVGAFLAAALLEAASEGGAVSGGLKLAAYSAGLGVPMVVSALLVDRLKGALAFLRERTKAINVVCGLLLVVFGVSMALPGYSSQKPAPAAATPPPSAAPAAATQSVETKTEVEVVGEEAFEREVLAAEGPVLVDFWAPWCGPCRQMAPVVAEIARSGKAKVVKVNVDENRELAIRYGIRGIPAFKLFRGGKVEREALGSTTRADLESTLGL